MSAKVFVNLHPLDMGDPGLIDSLREIQDILHVEQELIAEVSELAVTDVPAMRSIAERLKRVSIGFA